MDERFPMDSTYTNVWWLMDDLRSPMQQCFNLTDTETANMNFMKLYSLSDIIQSRVFADLQLCDTSYVLTETDLTRVNQTVLATLTLPLNDPSDSREMFISKMLRNPINLMQDIIDGNPSQHKYLIYSAHDWTVATMQMFFQSTNGNFTVVPYAA